jgi:hypothetical protein
MRPHHKHTRETRRSLDTVIDVKAGGRAVRTIPAGEASLARLASDPDLTIELTEPQTKEVQDISQRSRSTS